MGDVGRSRRLARLSPRRLLGVCDLGSPRLGSVGFRPLSLVRQALRQKQNKRALCGRSMAYIPPIA
jgi:hypothetical protein